MKKVELVFVLVDKYGNKYRIKNKIIENQNLYMLILRLGSRYSIFQNNLDQFIQFCKMFFL